VGASLHKLETMHTFYGPVNFDTAGNNIAKPMVITQVKISSPPPPSCSPTAPLPYRQMAHAFTVRLVTWKR
jgi:hypothetical protein